MRVTTPHSIVMVLGIGIFLVASTLIHTHFRTEVPIPTSSQPAVAGVTVDTIPRPPLGELPMVATSSFEIPETEWRQWYPVTVPSMIGGVAVEASVARTVDERIAGLSGTPYLPPHVVKLFVFDTPGEQSIWMKDMRYPLDIFWLSATGTVVHIEENVSPESFPRAFGSPVEALFVVEVVAGFTATHGIGVGATSSAASI